MGRARGSDATLQLGYEAVYGALPLDSSYRPLPFVSTSLGATQGLLESDLLGQGRAPFDPVQDVIVNTGDVVVPIDPLFFGYWLKLLLGAPSTTGSAAPYTHGFSSGQPALPSASIPIGHPRVPSFSTNYGVRANTLQVQQRRGGLINATIGCIAKGETTAGPTTTIPAPDAYQQFTRFAQASGRVRIDSTEVAGLVDASFSYTNNLDVIETIRLDKEIEDADPGMPAASGQSRFRFADHTLLNKAIAGTPVNINHEFLLDNYYLAFNFPRVFLPRPKRTIDGPNGVVASFDWQASSENGVLMTATLTGPAASYA